MIDRLKQSNAKLVRRITTSRAERVCAERDRLEIDKLRQEIVVLNTQLAETHVEKQNLSGT